ncbi:hypothetical protein VOLCADRAFT_118103 [Volvox carteri f. nagariensis]|uniref:UDENN domain-containing protein n=1 Tax=Volvox carteri f. nagariensis TaxID=3068 RepID=D8U1A2_VOLCA|nr:uncharacterized protein VOLCADRAFT_118103 [Volvox carteri f. nagariensis]EFJ46522.1 hypothetical protein VOLCADRAFT_118103 [Volvox carteri f. nagariensis]|eukprot:XP_002952379.1 hypothetical protein VOLCADRAFT_118103 [Volvox carteri f. nagariensis]
MSLLAPSQQWIVGICSVVFDIDVGQRIEHLVPEACLSKEEQHDVAFHSFPDSMSMELHARTSIKDSTFFFRIRRRGSLTRKGPSASAAPSTTGAAAGANPDEGGSGNSGGADGPAAPGPQAATAAADADADADAAAPAAVPANGNGYVVQDEQPGSSGGSGDHPNEEKFLYGFVFCRQRQDASLRRGGEQMSVVVLAEHPLSAALQPLAAVAGHRYFGSPGRGPLLQVYEELPLAFTTLTARLPAWGTLPYPSNVTAAEQYGGNTLPYLRSNSSRTLLLTGGGSFAGRSSSGRQTDDGGATSGTLPPPLPPPGGGGSGAVGAYRTLSGMSGGVMLSPASSTTTTASALLSPAPSLPTLPPLGSPAATAAALAASPFLSSSGGALYDTLPGEDTNGTRGAPVAIPQGVHRRVPSSPQMTAGEGATIHGVFHEMDVFTPLSGHLTRLWQLWEMTLLGRAMMLIAPTPGETSAGVAALLSLVAPLPYAADFRPYYCIHDIAFSRMASLGLLPGPEARDVPTLLGVTNLYFIRALPHWPNVLSIGKREGAVAAVQPPGSLAASLSRANAAVQALRQRTQGASILMSGHTEALWSTYKALCRPDQNLLQKLMLPKPGDVKSKVARIAFVNSDMIRRVGSPSAAVELYARFTSCLNFAAWFASRRRHVAHLIAPDWSDPAASGLTKHLDEVKLIELFFSVEQQLMEAQVSRGVGRGRVEVAAPDAPDEAAATVARLQRELAMLFFGCRMPEELQLTCVSSPGRRALLSSLPLSAGQTARLQQLMDMLQVGGS